VVDLANLEIFKTGQGAEQSDLTFKLAMLWTWC